MNYFLKLSLIKFIFLFHVFISCSGSATDDGNTGPVDPVEIIPSNLTLNIEVVGSNNVNPNGNGSGVVKFTANATNAVSYSFRFGTGDSQTTSGSAEYTYTDQGTKTYNVKVLAYSKTNNYISVDKSVTVYVKKDSEQGLLELLAGSSSRTWKINAAQDAHFSNGAPDKKYPTYWEGYAFSKNSSGFYDDEYIFNVDGTYKHKTNKTVFGKATYLTNDFGSTSQPTNSSGEIENYPLDDYQSNFIAIKEICWLLNSKKKKL